MEPEQFSRVIGKILGSAPYTMDERDRINEAMGAADSISELPQDIQQLLSRGSVGSRANPYHSKKDGKFAKSPGSGTVAAGALSSEQYAAITPGTAKGAIAARKSLDSTPAGRQLRETTQRWQDDTSEIINIQKGFMGVAQGKRVTGKQQQDATAFMHGIKGAPVSPPVFRGARISPTELAGYKKGGNIILPPSSFTSSQRIAGGFAKQPSKREVVPVIIRAKKGARAIPVEIYGDSSYKNEKEWISAGQFTVTGISKRPDGVTIIDVDHTAMFQW